MQHHWFRAKTFGWGWTPCAWQGWVVTVIYAGVIAAGALLFLGRSQHALGWVGYGATIVMATVALIIVCWKTGEKPGWRWGNRNDSQR